MAATEGCGGSRRKSTELEKYKRRLIRSVARKLKEKKEDMWVEMKNEIGSNCKKLWERMRMLTLKKLQRLLQADDRVALIGPVARMTITDWLLFDLVIVHEKIDVIERSKLSSDYNSKVLTNLFALVQRFEIEGKSGDELAEAWTAATVYYNSKGHQCSPMMLQRRWFQIKELTRHKFYKFWFKYRGNQRQLITAMSDSPDKLQKAIALRYPTVITNKFLSWEEAIENRLVILPDELGVKMRKVIAIKPTDTTAPDVVLIEPQIEVIDLGENSDSGDEKLQNEETTKQPTLVKVKKEPMDVDEEFEEEHEVYYPPEKGIEFDEEIERLEKAEENVDDDIVSDINVEKAEGVVIDPILSIDEPDANESEYGESDLNQENNDCLNTVEKNKEAAVGDDVESQGGTSTVSVEKVDSSMISNDQKVLEKDRQEDEPTDSHVNEALNDSNGFIAEIVSVASAGIKVENLDDVIETVVTPSIDPTTDYVSDELLPVISTVSSAGVEVERDLTVLDNTVVVDISMDDDNDKPDNVVSTIISSVSSKGVKIEIEADRIGDNFPTKIPSGEIEQNYDDVNNVVDDGSVKIPINSPVVEKDNTTVIDLDDFGDINMNMNFANEGIDFADDGIVYVEEDEDFMVTVKEPQAENDSVRNGAIKEEKESEDEESIDEEGHTQKFDLKLLMSPVVYTTKLEDMSVFDAAPLYYQVYNKESIEKIYSLSKPVSKKSVAVSEQTAKLDQKDENTEQFENDNDAVSVSDDDLFRNESIKESNDLNSESGVIDDTKRVKLTSYMLRKPTHRSYNPVLLCKNPDFNTRLKKLTVGFFMSARNRSLLQSCIPMTIDMSKAFEDKLIDGTLYLTPTSIDSTTTINLTDDVETTSAALVKPSKVQQSLMNIDDTLENKLKKCMAERVRGINLPDISQVRRLNQHLLTAEVTPLRLENEITSEINKQSSIKLDPEHYVQNIKDDINNLLTHQKVTDVTNTNINIDPMITQTQPCPPPAPLLATEPARVAPDHPPMITINTPVPEVQQILQSERQVESSNSVQSKQQKTTNVETNVPKLRKPIRRTVYPTITWNKRASVLNQTNQELHQSDALLTIDTLYKMLSALDPSTKLAEPKKKSHKKKVLEKKPNEETSTQVIDITDDEVKSQKPKRKPRVKSTIRTNYGEYCCWCSYRIDRIQSPKPDDSGPRPHKCKLNKCVCCCKALYYEGDLASVATATKSIELTQKVQNVSQTIEHVVQVVNPTNLVKPTYDVSIQINLDDDAQVSNLDDDTQVRILDEDPQVRNLDDDDTQVEPVSDLSSSNTAVHLKTTDLTQAADGTILDTSKDGSAELTPLHPSPSKQPTPKIRVYSSCSKLGVSSTLTPLNNDKPDLVNETHFGNRENKQRNINVYKTNRDTKSKLQYIRHRHCTCARPTITKVNQGKIEINGKSNCPIHKKRIKESKVFLSKKRIKDQNQPFFVGKGKILLTNIKMPNTKSDTTIVAQTVSPTVPLISEPPPVQVMTLPVGVQVILLPDQTLSYIIQPDVTLTPEEFALLPQFLAAIQQEIQAVGITLPADHATNGANLDVVIDLDKDESSNQKEQETKENSTVENEDFEMNIDLLGAPKKIDLVTSTTSAIGTPEKPEVKTRDAGAGEKSNIPVMDVSLETTNSDSKSNHADEATNKKSLLSDLMEMSGIMEEDLAPSHVTTPPEPILLGTQNFVLHKEVPCVTQICKPSPLPTIQYTATDKNGSFELIAVTSFAELKYSCDNNGIFFKLDLESGQLTSINVCIQKFPNKAQPISDEKSVIDLTDDPDIRVTGTTDDGADSSVEQPSPYKIKISTILQKKQKLMERLSNNLKPVNILQSKKHVARILKRNRTLHRDPQFTFYSKRKLDKIEAKIDLVDSDAPMEEEYLLSDDSSDDEPLIKKVKRKHLMNNSGPSSETGVDEQAEVTESILNDGQSQPTAARNSMEQEQHVNIEERLSEPEQSNVEKSSGEPGEVQQQIDEEKQLDLERLGEKPLDENDLDEEEDDFIDQEDEEMNYIHRTIDSMHPVPTNLVLSGGALNAHNIPLNRNFGAECDESQEDDCILGV